MQITAIETGKVRVRAKQVEGAPGPARVLRTLLDREWTEPLPILCWLIDHPEGLILVDTGETPRTAEPGYFPRWHPYHRFAVQMEVGPGQGVGDRLRALGVDPADISRVVLTHLHTDHAGGLGDVAGSEVLVSRKELAAATSRLAVVNGYLPHRWPQGISFTEIDFEDGPVGPFERSHTLTEAGDVVAIPTPGHTPGHLSVVVRTGGTTVVLAGDTSYTEATMRSETLDGVSPDAPAARETLKHFAHWAADEPLLYLPTHDPESAARLATLGGHGIR
ncbi:MAG: N-acyl homoserine lactonase family protein [Solirubrobacteraceae bacterium]|nr:N-acyl homoserine lactonase family protein [Solirubrobacteraceae bacterium]